MDEVVAKAQPKLIKWACITLHPWLPSRSEQIAGARAWGAHEDWLDDVDVSTTFIDDATTLKRTTKFTDKLPERAALIAALHKETAIPSHVFFRSPICVGFSAAHAQETIEAIWARGALVYVQTLDMLLKAGDDIELVKQLATRAANTKHQADYRKRKSG
jgi:hypothetical protein